MDDNLESCIRRLRSELCLIGAKEERTRMLAFVRAERSHWQAKYEQCFGHYERENEQLIHKGRVLQCESFITWLEKENGRSS